LTKKRQESHKSLTPGFALFLQKKDFADIKKQTAKRRLRSAFPSVKNHPMSATLSVAINPDYSIGIKITSNH